MNKYIKKLDDKFKESEKIDSCPHETKLGFLGDHIFDFTTYDGDADEMFAREMLEVIKCILNRKTFEYQEDEQCYINYLTMINMPFLKGKLEWGTSIRGAWFDDSGKEVYDVYGIKVPQKEIKSFMSAILEWITQQ